MLMGSLRMFSCFLAMFQGRLLMLLNFLMFANVAVMSGFTMVMRCGFVFANGPLMMLARGVSFFDCYRTFS